MRKSVPIFVILCAVSMLILVACENDPAQLQPNPYELASTIPVIYVATTAGDYFMGFPADRFLITDDAIRQELLEIINTSKQSPLTEEEIMSFSLRSFRTPFDFIIDDIRYSFETQGRLLVVFDEEGYMSKYYHASDFERVTEIHIQQRPE